MWCRDTVASGREQLQERDTGVVEGGAQARRVREIDIARFADGLQLISLRE